ncbi:hypothetical protein M569_10457, partial [Genlisea aurea]
TPMPILLLLLLLLSTPVLCAIYKVGDMDSWAIPSPANHQIYASWAKYDRNLSIGDSLFFLYPPSQDSVIQVTKEAYDACALAHPILTMNDGNSLFNITASGDFYFTSGVDGHCGKSQKLHISVYGDGSSSSSSSSSSAESPAASAPSYPVVFGSIPTQRSASSSHS